MVKHRLRGYGDGIPWQCTRPDNFRIEFVRPGEADSTTDHSQKQVQCDVSTTIRELSRLSLILFGNPYPLVFHNDVTFEDYDQED